MYRELQHVSSPRFADLRGAASLSETHQDPAEGFEGDSSSAGGSRDKRDTGRAERTGGSSNGWVENGTEAVVSVATRRVRSYWSRAVRCRLIFRGSSKYWWQSEQQ